MAKTFEMLFSIGGQISGTLRTALGGATGMLDALGKKSREVQNAQADAARLQQVGAQWRQSARAYAEIQAKIRAMAESMRTTEGATKKAKSEFDATVSSAKRLKTQVEQQRAAFVGLAASVRAAGGSVRRLATYQASLARQSDAARKAMERMQGVAAKQAANRDARQKMVGNVMAGPMGAVAAGVGGAVASNQLMTAGADFQHAMQLGANTGGLSAKQRDETGQAIRGAAIRTNQEVMGMMGAWQALIARGLDNDRAVASLDVIGKTATGTGASMDDLAKTSFALIDNLKIAPEELEAAMDILAQSGKSGAFELKDMATFFPQLTASFRSLGITGKDSVASLGAALQVAMKGAANPDEAANNMKNFLTKMSSPETVKKFKEEYGVNLEKALKGAMKRGENPVEFMIKMIDRLTKGDKFRIGELFGDMQVLNFLTPMMQNLEEFKKIKEESLSAKGTVNEDFLKMMATTKEQMNGVTNSAKNLAVSLSQSLFPAFGSILGAIKPMLDFMGRLAAEYPKVTAGVLGLAGAGVGLGTALAALGLVSNLAQAGWLKLQLLWTYAGFILEALKIKTIAFTAVQLASAAGAKVWAGAQMLLNTAFWANPITWVVAGAVALGVAAWWVVKNWETVKAFFGGLWESIAAKLAPIADGVRNVFVTAVEWVSSLNLYEAGAAFLTTFIDGVTSKAAAAWEAVKNVFANIANLIPHSDAKVGPFSTLTAGGAAIIQTMAAGLTAVGGGPLARAMADAFGAAQGAAGEAGVGVAFSGGAGAGQAGPVTINFSPVITVQGDASPEALEAPLLASEARLRTMIENILGGDRRVSYA